MRHRIDHDIDAHGITSLLRELVEILDMFSFTLPPVSQISVVTNNCHHATFVVEDRAVVRFTGIGSLVRITVPPRVDARYLWLFLQIINAVENFVFLRKLLRLTIGKYTFDLFVKIAPLAFAPKIVNHHEPAVEQVPA